MNEWQLFGLGVAKFGLVLVFAALYSIAGRDKTPKALRRFLAPILLVCGSVWLGFTYTLPIFIAAAISLGVMIAGLCMGYGGDKLWIKVRKRAVCALVICSAGLPIVIITGNWSLLVLQYIVGISASVILGVLNDLDAPTEEMMIAILMCSLYPYMF